MTTATHAGNFVAPARMLADFGTMLAADIDPEKFADRCGTSINHPAFTLGHCTYYLGIAANTLGASIGCGPDEKRLYAIGVECVDTPGTYPAKDDVLAAYTARCGEVAEFLESCEDAAFEAPNEDGPFEDRFDSKGQVAAFMVLVHTSFHLGQISGWRRAVGMGPAMKA